MLRNLLADELPAEKPQPVNLLAPESSEGPALSTPPVPKASTYLPDVNLTIDHPADISHDALNDAIQTDVYGRPRHMTANLDRPLGVAAMRKIAEMMGPIGAPAVLATDVAVREPKLAQESAKAGVRMLESIPRGIAGLMDMLGRTAALQNSDLEDPGFETELTRKVALGFAEIGKTAYDFYKDRMEEGPEAPDPEVFRGSFMSNPSVTRLAANIIQNVPLVAATAAASLTTGGVAPLMLFGGMAAGEAFEESKAALGGEASGDAGTQAAAMTGAMSGIGNVVLMALPIHKGLEALGLGAKASSTASFTALGALMTPFNNVVAKMGGDDARQLFEGMTESLITMAASGFILGAMSPGRGKQIDGLVQKAAKEGVTPREIDAVREAITDQIVENAPAVSAALKEKAIVAKEAAEAKKTAKNEKRKTDTVNLIAESILAQKGVPKGEFTPELVIAGKREALERIEMKEYGDRLMGEPGKLLNREKRLRFELKKELAEIDAAAEAAAMAPVEPVKTEAATDFAKPAETVGKEFFKTFDTDGKGVDMTVAGEAFGKKIEQALADGSTVTLLTDGKEVPIVAVRKSMMQDAQGQSWGNFNLAMGADTVRIEPKGSSAKPAASKVTQEVPVSKVAQDGPLKGIEGTGEKTPLGLSENVEASAVLKEIIKEQGGLGTLPTGKTMEMEAQATKAVEFMDADFARAKRVALGQEAAPAGLYPENVYTAVRTRAEAQGDAALLRDLAVNSQVPRDARVMGQRIKSLDSGNPESPVDAMREMVQVREQAVERRTKQPVSESKKQEAKKIKERIVKEAPKKEDWISFIQSLKC
jgi:hypothetical protein